MNKTISISLSGQVFQIDELAYETLKNYLENIRRRFSAADGGQEIVADIESRIAELFLEKLNDRKQVITSADVDAMIHAMGRPEDFDTPDAEPKSATTQATAAARRLFRNPDEKVLGGVCSGLSAYLGIQDPIWMRLLFIISPFLTVGMALFIYLILWIIIPEAKTASEKLQMRGEYVNISNIEKTIREDLNDLSQRISNGKVSTKARGFLQNVIDFIIKVIVGLVKIIGKLFGIALIMVGFFIVIGIMIALLLPSEFTSISIASLYPAIFASQAQLLMAGIGFFLVVFIPALLVLFAGFHLLIPARRKIKGLGITMVALWIAGIVLMSVSISRTAADFTQTEVIRTEIPLAQPAQDTLILEGARSKLKDAGAFHVLPEIGEFAETDSQFIFTDNVKLDITRSASGNYELIQTSRADGRKSVFAQRRAANISHEFSQSGTVLTFSEHIAVPKKDHYRDQQVSLVLRVPEGKSVYLDASIANVIYDIKNVHDMYDGDMVGHTWIMLAEGLTCLDCSPSDFSEGRVSPQGEVNRSMDLKDFSRINARGDFNLEVKQGDEFSVQVDGNEQFIENMEIDKEGNKLIIRLRGMHLWGSREGIVTVIMPELEQLETGGSNRGIVTGFKQEKMKLEVKGASSVHLKSSVSELQLEEGGASTVTLTGNGSVLKAEVSGSSDLKAFDYPVKQCDVDVSGSSEAEVNVQREMNAEAGGASRIRYKGLPKISSDVTGYSSIKPEQ